MPKSTTAVVEPIRDRPETATQTRILDSAVSLFADHGFSEVTVRDIAEHAGANPAAISYYFGAKEQLIRLVIKSVIAPLNDKRLAALDAVERKTTLTVEDVVRAMVEPTVNACMGSQGRDRHYARILVLSFALRQQFVDEVMAQQTDRIADRFVNAFMRAAPGMDRGTMYWRYDFMIGATMHILLDSSRGFRIRRLSDSTADTGDIGAVTEQLVRFVTAGFRSDMVASTG